MDVPNPARSFELLSADSSVLIVVDVQEKFLPSIPQVNRLIWSIRRLLDAAQALAVPAIASVHYPTGLGQMVAELASRFDQVYSKRAFSCLDCQDFSTALTKLNRPQALVVGIESHVCVLQTVLDLLAQGYRVHVAADAVAARQESDTRTALARMAASGATITSSEAAMFEWCRTSDRPEFKTISALVREIPPA